MEQDIFMQEFKRFRQLDIQSDEFKHSILSAHEPNLEFLTPKVNISFCNISKRESLNQIIIFLSK